MNFWLRGFVGAAIKCYICNSLTDSGCSGQANNKYLKDCSELVDGSKYTLCRKIDQDVPPEDGRKYLAKNVEFRQKNLLIWGFYNFFF